MSRECCCYHSVTIKLKAVDLANRKRSELATKWWGYCAIGPSVWNSNCYHSDLYGGDENGPCRKLHNATKLYIWLTSDIRSKWRKWHWILYILRQGEQATRSRRLGSLGPVFWRLSMSKHLRPRLNTQIIESGPAALPSDSDGWTPLPVPVQGLHASRSLE